MYVHVHVHSEKRNVEVAHFLDMTEKRAPVAEIQGLATVDWTPLGDIYIK